MFTIEESRADRYPFKIGDRVKIKYLNHPIETGVIDDLHKSIQKHVLVVHAVMVKIDGCDKLCVVCASLLEKI